MDEEQADGCVAAPFPSASNDRPRLSRLVDTSVELRR